MQSQSHANPMHTYGDPSSAEDEYRYATAGLLSPPEAVAEAVRSLSELTMQTLLCLCPCLCRRPLLCPFRGEARRTAVSSASGAGTRQTRRVLQAGILEDWLLAAARLAMQEREGQPYSRSLSHKGDARQVRDGGAR